MCLQTLAISSFTLKQTLLIVDDVYQKALAEGEMDVAYARIMFLGAAGVGKTSLKRSLMKQRWDPLIDSTVLSDVDSYRPIGREWQTLCHEEEENGEK